MCKYFAVPLAVIVLQSSAIAGFLPDKPFSKDAAGTVSAVFLKNPSGARAQAMGGSGLALTGPESVFWNPAGLAGVCPERESLFHMDYERMLETSYRSSLAYVRPLGNWVFGTGIV